MGALTQGTFFTIEANAEARRRAIEQLKDKARMLGADAIIGIDIDISDINGRGVMVSANGTAVKLKKLQWKMNR